MNSPTAVREITRYRYKGREYATLDQVKAEIENHLGVIIDSMNITLTPEQKLDILQGLIQNKRLVAELLSVNFEQSGDPGQAPLYTNILDIGE